MIIPPIPPVNPTFPHAAALAVAEELRAVLAPACERIAIVGSLRRQKPAVGDIELLYIPRYDEAKLPGEMFAQAEQNLADLVIEKLLARGDLGKRLNVKGHAMFGPQNKYVQHAASGIAVDLFATTEACWFNYLVCRTGGLENNLAICRAAQALGWSWNPTGPGFTRDPPIQTGAVLTKRACASEREVFEFVGLPYREPEDRP